MRDSGYFVRVSENRLNSRNEFVRLTASSTRVALLPTNDAAVALLRQSSRAVDFMVYKEAWEDNNYYNPRRQINEIIKKRESFCNVW
jgi:hypothetical protein